MENKCPECRRCKLVKISGDKYGCKGCGFRGNIPEVGLDD